MFRRKLLRLARTVHPGKRPGFPQWEKPSPPEVNKNRREKKGSGMTPDLLAGRRGAFVMSPIGLPLTLGAILALGLVALQAHLLCDALCVHGTMVLGEICRG